MQPSTFVPRMRPYKTLLTQPLSVRENARQSLGGMRRGTAAPVTNARSITAAGYHLRLRSRVYRRSRKLFGKQRLRLLNLSIGNPAGAPRNVLLFSGHMIDAPGR